MQLCSALSDGSGSMSQLVADVGLEILQQVTANKTEPISSHILVSSVRFMESVANTDWDAVDTNSSKQTLQVM